LELHEVRVRALWFMVIRSLPSFSSTVPSSVKRWARRSVSHFLSLYASQGVVHRIVPEGKWTLDLRQ
jgi:hypothetical protein